MQNDIADDGGSYMRMFRLCKQENRFDLGMHGTVHLGNGPLILAIGRSTQTPQDVPGSTGRTKIDSQAFVLVHFNSFLAPENIAYPLQPVFQREKTFFVRIVSYGNNNFIEQRNGSAHHRFVTYGEGIERTRK